MLLCFIEPIVGGMNKWGGNRPKPMSVTILIKKFYFTEETPFLNFDSGQLTANPLLKGFLLSAGPCLRQGRRTGALRRDIGWQHRWDGTVSCQAL